MLTPSLTQHCGAVQAAENASYHITQTAAEQQAATLPVTEVPIPSQTDTAMDVDVDVRHKRKAEESPPAESSKKARIGEFITGNGHGHPYTDIETQRSKATPIEEVYTCVILTY
jgi:hypothetical protein